MGIILPGTLVGGVAGIEVGGRLAPHSHCGACGVRGSVIDRGLHTALTFVFLAAVAHAAQAQPKPPDFTGTWKLLPTLSTGPVAPGTMTLRITGNATRLVIHQTLETPAGEFTDSMVVRPGAPARTDSLALFGSVRPRSVAGSWRGDTLVIVSAIAPDQGGRVATERWTLEASGRRLAIQTTAGAPLCFNDGWENRHPCVEEKGARSPAPHRNPWGVSQA